MARFSFHPAFVSLFAVSVAVGCSSASETTSSTEHADTASATSMQACPTDNSDPKCPAGSFAIICKDGTHEVATVSEIQHDQICPKPAPANECACDPANSDCDGPDGDNDTDDLCKYSSCATAPDGTPCGGANVCTSGVCGPKVVVAPTPAQCLEGWPTLNGQCAAPVISASYVADGCVGTTGWFVEGANFELRQHNVGIADYGPQSFGANGNQENWNVITSNKLCVTVYAGFKSSWVGHTIYVQNPDGKTSNSVVVQDRLP
jgi:hypothetical protein